MMTISFWIIIIFLFTYEPIYGYFDYQKFKVKVRSNPKERVKYYKKVMLGLWIPTIFILSLVAFGSLTLQDIGLTSVRLNTHILGKWTVYISIGLAVIYALCLIYYLIGSKISKKMKQEIVKIKSTEIENSKFADIMPVTKEDKKVWTLVSWTAGVTEEIIYRGFLIFALTQLFPTMSVWVVLTFASIVFGLAHTYQGFFNVIKTALFGLFFAVLYVGLNSIIPLILLHFLIDYIGKIGDAKEID